MQLYDLFRHAGWVAWPLGFCAVLALGVFLERLYTLMTLSSLEEKAFAAIHNGLEKNNDAVLRDQQIAAAPVTQIMLSLTALRGAGPEAIQQTAEIAVGLQRLRLRRYLTILATVGSIAPFVGLFGTVIGVITAFKSMSASSAAGLDNAAMAAGIGEALSATAVGLLVAIPAVIAYNFTLGKVQSMMLPIQSHVAQLTPLLTRRVMTREKQEV